MAMKSFVVFVFGFIGDISTGNKNLEDAEFMTRHRIS
ncbi:hypothetical protein AvCA_17730 [Azotobacter vinelandii CA]|uniref:Uncharacterized protein n=2 Tax=Azotobacter vinelandii TaxID=354 RepID=C1DDL5_AZOVD|nr:hypothetical protein Avin_17730 [Azotobacter vinelandii DJ]AGK15188.1 hypothetical protein AvCA_17730 [Azotobacter vinelandii CA]AGK20146.1 hypothetical protein AvCA6_17730 [Azotobacter vinelandii CA6]